MINTLSKGVMVALVIGGVAVLVTMVFAARPNDPRGREGLVICHATGNSQNPYNEQKVSRDSSVGGHIGHAGPLWSEGATSWGDIIPAFTIEGSEYPGLNWNNDDLTLNTIYNNRCKVR